MLTKCFIYFYAILFIRYVAGQSDYKSSLTFVIDDTASMGNDINQVKAGAKEIFDTVLNHKSSQIENFILVTFNDLDCDHEPPAPGINQRAITKDCDVFRAALATIEVTPGNCDCPEYSMSGIIRALEISLPGSYIYVFTDATAKDYERFEELKRLALMKTSQVVFVLTGNCGESEEAPAYQVYYTIAHATNGAVFNLEKQEIGQILDYVKISIEGRRTTLADFPFPPGSHSFTFDADPEIKKPTIAIETSDPDPSVDITAPDGSKPSKDKIVDTKTNMVYAIDVTKPGVHTVEVKSLAKAHAVVTARSDINFKHGFSSFTPSSISDTRTSPAPDVESYLSIKLIEGDVELKTVKILDMSNNIVKELPLTISDEKAKFYVSTIPVVPPNTTFRIAIIAYDPISKTNLTRTALTPVEVQKILPGDKIEDRSPSVTIEGDAKINSEYDERLKLICKVSGYPKPDIVWKNEDKGSILSGKESAVDLPYDYVNILTIEKVNENATYKCEASNPSGSDAKNVEVETIPHYFTVLDSTKKINIEYEKEGQIHCLVAAYPPAEITWTKNGKKIATDGNIEISANNSTITFKYTKYSDRGKYICKARNVDKTQLLYKFVTVVGIERPVIDKHINETVVKKGSSVTLECKLLEGKPKPTISWFFKPARKSIEFTQVEEWEDKETVVVENASANKSGTYQCQVQNEISVDNHEIDLEVEQRPTIAKDKSFIKKVSGSVVSMSCNADGVPEPFVTWLKDGVNITDSYKKKIVGKHSLRLTVTPSDSGNYTCTATSRLGVASRTVIVEVTVPVSIIPPDGSRLTALVGNTLLLPCEAEGVPKPEIKWMYNNLSSPAHSKKIIKTKGDGPLSLERVQLSEAGSYTCVARNSEGSKSITYTLDVFAPPIIENTYIDKHFVVVEGDLVLQITCKATGIPKPTISWTKDGLNLALGPTYYEEKGTLIIRNVPKDAKGVYKCEAVNDIGSAQEIYEVSVSEYPMPRRATSFITIEEGKPAEIKCNIPHKNIHQLRWFKDGKLIQSGELTLINPSLSDSGHYTCRVGYFSKAVSGNVRIQVGYKPKFTSLEDVDIEMVEGPVSLSCESNGEPKPDISWFHDGKLLNETSPVLNFPDGINTPGQYRCEVQNVFGTISRTFNAVPRDCFVNTDKLTKLQPLVVTSSLTWPELERSKQFTIFTKGEIFYLFCPNRFNMFPKKYVTAFCGGGMNILINGRKYDYADIQCTEEVTHVVQRTGKNCMRGNTEKVKIVYKVVDTENIKVYEICMDKTNNVPLYAMHTMQPSLADEEYEATWSDSDEFRMNFEDLYSCKTQTKTISSWLSKSFHNTDECCFSKRQLVSPKDVSPGVAQRSTYSYLNVLPHWGTCNAHNWEDIERRVRNFVKSSYGEILVWTGGAKELTLTSAYNDTKNNFFTDRRGNRYPVPLFFWKVIQDQGSKSSLAIVQVNVPDLSPTEVSKYTLCRDVCDNTDWMKSSEWHDVKRGYTYCCTLPEFENAFEYEGVFNPDMNKILTLDAALLPESS